MEESNDFEDEGWKKNKYYQTLKQVATQLENYDSDKLIPMYGFGAILPNGEDHSIAHMELKNGEKQRPIEWTSHCFAMNGDTTNPSVHGVEEVLKTYRDATPLVEFYGPTFMSPFLKQIND